jgi:hypothetical protein
LPWGPLLKDSRCTVHCCCCCCCCCCLRHARFVRSLQGSSDKAPAKAAVNCTALLAKLQLAWHATLASIATLRLPIPCCVLLCVLWLPATALQE